MSERIDWQSIVYEAAAIVRSYSTGVTLRQLYYRLVARQLIPNKQSAYSRLSSVTAQARREGRFPSLVDNTRALQAPYWYSSPAEAIQELERDYIRDRTEGQEYTIVVAVEKNALRTLLTSWYEHMGIPVAAMGGYPSQTFVDQIARYCSAQDRPAVLIYGGDFDATGMDILRDLEERTYGTWEEVRRVALNADQITEYDLPPAPGKMTDPRRGGFLLEQGQDIQVELDALPPDTLEEIYNDSIMEYWDDDVYNDCLAHEETDKEKLVKAVELIGDE